MWFKKHLSLTLFFAWVAANIIVYGGLIVAVDAPTPVLLCVILIPVAASLGTEVWYLRQKRRSLAWLLINLLSWIGLIVLLCLENRADLDTAEEECLTCALSVRDVPLGSAGCTIPGGGNHEDGVCTNWQPSKA